MKTSFCKQKTYADKYNWRNTNKYPERRKALRGQETLGSLLYSYYDTALQHYVNMQLQIPVSLKKQVIILDTF